MAKNLLFEIGVEEIPARFMQGSIDSLVDMARKALTEARLSFDAVRGMGTPRRLTLFVDGLSEVQTDLKEELKGPAKKGAFDGNGEPTKALAGFLKSKGLTLDDITVKEIKGGEYVFAEKNEKGQNALAVLPEILTGIVLGLKFPKPMRWNDHEFRFIRPIHWLVALLGTDIIPMQIVDVKSGNISRSHRFYGAGDITIASPETYVQQLLDNYVMVDPSQRRETIKKQIAVIEEKNNVVVEKDEELLDEVVYLLEYPTALMGTFDESYLKIPKESVITPMKEHQRYFPVMDKDGNLLNHFVTVRNGLERNIEIVTAGNESVLRARLEDAKFFYEEDLKIDLGSNIERLKPIVFHATMGTLYEKVDRMVQIAAYLADELGEDAEKAKRGAYLAKADLVSNMVYEFPELQGIMGEYYSLAQGEDVAVARSIRESYMPRFAGDELPESNLGRIVSIADKIDSIVGFFSMNLEPTGSQDPYALRRQAMGVTQIVLDGSLKLDMGKLIEFAYDLIEKSYKPEKTREETRIAIYNFFRQRLGNVLGALGLKYDTINAVVGDAPVDFCRIQEKGKALEKFRANEDFIQLMAGFTRVNNLVKKAESVEFDDAILTQPAEIVLVSAYRECASKIDKFVADKDDEGVLKAIAELRKPIDDFLTDIMVNCEDEALKNSRLGFLKSLRDMMLKAADFTAIQ